MVTLLSLLLLIPSPCSQEVAGVCVEEGEINESEKILLIELNKKMIPLPKSILIRDSLSHYGLYTLKEEIMLSRNRKIHPDSVYNSHYLYGRNNAPDSVHVKDVYILAHEIGHHIQAKLYVPDYLRPVNTSEVEADIIALVLLEFVFGTSYKTLGFPDEVQTKEISRKTEIFKNEYKSLIMDTWKIKTLKD